ncbi:PAP7, partial [Symbiodinium pilosum]
AEETQLLLQMETGEGRPTSSRWREVYMAIAVTLALVAAACCLPIPSVHQQVLRPTANVFQALWHSRTYDDERLHGQSEQAERENGFFAQDSTFSHPPAATKTHGDAAFAARQSAYRAGWLEDGEGDTSTSSQPDFRRGDWLDANWDDKTPPGTIIEHVDTSRSGRADFRGDWLDVNWDDKTADTVIEHVDTSTSSRPVFEGDWLDTNLNNETPGTVVEHDWVEVGDSSTDSDGDGEGIPDEAPDTGSLDGIDGDSDGFGDGPGFDAALPSNWHNDVHDSSTLPATTTIPPGPFPAAETYHNNYDSDNPLGVKMSLDGGNYFLILGDWGKAGGPGSCQKAVAAHLRAYAEKQANESKTLLFVASVGDNFYWTGATPEAWEFVWSQPYGVNDPNSPVYQVPWLSVYGNHDYGNHDPYAFCPHKDESYRRKIINGQAYSSYQLNQDRNPTRPFGTELYWLPDYNYHYAIPSDADPKVEVIAVDTTALIDAQEVGGDGSGRDSADALCGGRPIAQSFLNKTYQAGRRLVIERAQKNKAATAPKHNLVAKQVMLQVFFAYLLHTHLCGFAQSQVLIIQHYPNLCPRDLFEKSLPVSRRGKVKVLCSSAEKCRRKRAQGCVTFKSSGRPLLRFCLETGAAQPRHIWARSYADM